MRRVPDSVPDARRPTPAALQDGRGRSSNLSREPDSTTGIAPDARPLVGPPRLFCGKNRWVFQA